MRFIDLIVLKESNLNIYIYIYIYIYMQQNYQGVWDLNLDPTHVHALRAPRGRWSSRVTIESWMERWNRVKSGGQGNSNDCDVSERRDSMTGHPMSGAHVWRDTGKVGTTASWSTWVGVVSLPHFTLPTWTPLSLVLPSTWMNWLG